MKIGCEVMKSRVVEKRNEVVYEISNDRVEEKEFFFFFFKQKTAYEVRLSLVGSEMFIRDSQRSHDRYKKAI